MVKLALIGFVMSMIASSLALSPIALAEIVDYDKVKIDQELGKGDNKISGKALVLIYADNDWSASIEGSDSVSATKDGSANAKIPIECKNGFLGFQKGIYSLNIQKGSEGGHLTVAVIQDGKLLKGDTTTAEFGIVGFAGELWMNYFCAYLIKYRMELNVVICRPQTHECV